MKQKKWLYIALVLCLLLSGCGGKITQPEQKDPGEKTDDPAGQTETAVTTSISYNNDNLLLRFSCGEDGHWYWTDDKTFPLDERYVLRMVELLSELREVPVSEELPAVDAEVGEEAPEKPNYGLEDSSKTLTVSGSQGETVYRVGNQLDDVLYLATLNEEGGIAVIYQAEGVLMDFLSSDIFSLSILPTMPQVSAENVQSVKVGSGSKESILHGSEKGWIHAGSDVTKQVTALLEAFSALQIERCLDYKPSEGVAELCGLDQPRAEVAVTYTNEVGKVVESSVCVGGVRDIGGVFITINGEDTIYRASEEKVLPLIDFVNGL